MGESPPDPPGVLSIKAEGEMHPGSREEGPEAPGGRARSRGAGGAEVGGELAEYQTVRRGRWGEEEREGTRQCVTEDLQGTLGDRKKGCDSPQA